VINPFGDHEHLPGFQAHISISEVDSQTTIHHNEYLIRARVAVPDEFPLDFCDLEVVIIHLSNDPGRPQFGKQAEFLLEIDRFQVHKFAPGL